MLQQRNASEQSISQFMELMNDCEFARYAPATDIAMTNDFERAVERISELEKQLTTKDTKKAQRAQKIEL